jgi:hypothetical protein
MVKYKVWYYVGLAWLAEGKTFDFFDEASDELLTLAEKEKSEDEKEVFLFNSKILEVRE